MVGYEVKIVKKPNTKTLPPNPPPFHYRAVWDNNAICYEEPNKNEHKHTGPSKPLITEQNVYVPPI